MSLLTLFWLTFDHCPKSAPITMALAVKSILVPRFKHSQSLPACSFVALRRFRYGSPLPLPSLLVASKSCRKFCGEASKEMLMQSRIPMFADTNGRDKRIRRSLTYICIRMGLRMFTGVML
eukprot:scaffold261767_cov17-Prasinocladus_malaysianus.AAC.1